MSLRHLSMLLFISLVFLRASSILSKPLLRVFENSVNAVRACASLARSAAFTGLRLCRYAPSNATAATLAAIPQERQRRAVSVGLGAGPRSGRISGSVVAWLHESMRSSMRRSSPSGTPAALPQTAPSTNMRVTISRTYSITTSTDRPSE